MGFAKTSLGNVPRSIKMTAICDARGIITGGPPWSSESRKNPKPFNALFVDDFLNRSLGVAYPGWDSKSIVVDDHPGGIGRALRCRLDAATPPVCGGSHFFGGRSNLPQPIPIGKTIWYSQKRYHQSSQSWAYCFSNADFSEAQACGKEADGNQWLKDMVLGPSTGTARIYVQPAVSRRSVAQVAGGRIISETGPTYHDVSGMRYPLDEWFTNQVMVHVSSDGDGIIRHWINRTLVNEVFGRNVTSGNSIAQWGIGDYWNGVPYTDGEAGRLDFWAREFIIASDIDGYGIPTGTDADGNIFIDPATTVAELKS